jgi:hypothetical protein
MAAEQMPAEGLLVEPELRLDDAAVTDFEAIVKGKFDDKPRRRDR